MWRAPSAVSTEFGPTIGRSGDSAVIDGASSGLAVNSERTWSGWLVTTDVLIDPGPAEDLAELAPRAEDELDLALVEAQQLQHPRQLDRRRQRSRRRFDGAGLGLDGLTDQDVRLCQSNHYIDECLMLLWHLTVTWATP